MKIHIQVGHPKIEFINLEPFIKKTSRWHKIGPIFTANRTYIKKNPHPLQELCFLQTVYAPALALDWILSQIPSWHEDIKAF